MDAEIEHDKEDSDFDDPMDDIATDEDSAQSLKRKAGQQGQRQSSRRKRTRSSTVTSSGEDDETGHEEPIPQDATQRAPTSQGQTESQNLAATVRAMLNQAFGMWSWAPESLAVRELIRQMTVATVVEGGSSMDDVRKLNCELWAQLAFEAIERRA
ncbi:hypothetical protein BDV97DRAFT_398121 [Delphinella strobiligena]|nr:hypothetical protein BDV97DRAFT_398121 [Delphinella strobiligena]